jgi:hypothetical protein
MPTTLPDALRAWPLWLACLAVLATPCPASEPPDPTAPAGTEAPARPLAWVLEPGEARDHGVELELDTQTTVTQGAEKTVRHTSAVASFRIESLGLRRRHADEYVVERRVQDFQLAVLSTTDGSTIEVTMDDKGLTVRQGREQPHAVPWANVPQGRGGEIGDLLGRAMTCTVNRFGGAVAIDERMAPWQRVLDSMDLTPLLLPMVPVPDTAVEPGMTWTVTGRRQVQLSRPWGTLELETRTEAKLTAYERRNGRDLARISFVSTTKPSTEQVRLDYNLTVRGEIALDLDGAVVGGEAEVTLAGSAAVVDALHGLAGTGTLRFTGPAGTNTPPHDGPTSESVVPEALASEDGSGSHAPCCRQAPRAVSAQTLPLSP